MTKLVPLRSLEHAIRRVFLLLGDCGVEAAIEDRLGLARSASLIRKCGDPDDGAHQLQMRYAIALDMACWEAHRQAPLFEAYRHLVGTDSHGDANDDDASKERIVDGVVALQIALGNLAEMVREAYSADSPDPSGLTQSERHHLFEAVNLLESCAETLKSVIATD